MPTPSDETIERSTPIDHVASSRSSFAGCPPEDDRVHSSTLDERVDGAEFPQQPPPPPSRSDAHLSERASREEPSVAGTTSQRRYSEQDVDADAGSSESASPAIEMSKAEHIEDAGIIAEPSSPTIGSTPDATVENDIRLAQSMSAAAISPPAPSPLYLHFPDADQKKTKSMNSTTSFLRPGSRFRGTQQSDKQVYDVQVEIKDVDLAESFLCGYLRIQGLTDDHPTLTTFFEGEVIGPKYLFKTGHPSWNSSEKIDLQHWARFPAWRPLAKSARSPNFTLKNYQQREHLFMRWKEYFLVPDHRVKTITGASFEGFYYICFNQSSGNVSGIYFHAKSEKYQQLELKHVDDRGCMPAVEFR